MLCLPQETATLIKSPRITVESPAKQLKEFSKTILFNHLGALFAPMKHEWSPLELYELSRATRYRNLTRRRRSLFRGMILSFDFEFIVLKINFHCSPN